jgi:hypothetical protein
LRKGQVDISVHVGSGKSGGGSVLLVVGIAVIPPHRSSQAITFGSTVQPVPLCQKWRCMGVMGGILAVLFMRVRQMFGSGLLDVEG